MFSNLSTIFLLLAFFNAPLLANDLKTVSFDYDKEQRYSKISLPFSIDSDLSNSYRVFGYFDDKPAGFGVEPMQGWVTTIDDKTKKYVHVGQLAIFRTGIESDTFLSLMADYLSFDRSGFIFEERVLVDARAITSTKVLDDAPLVRIMLDFKRENPSYLTIDKRNNTLSFLEGMGSERGAFLFSMRETTRFNATKGKPGGSRQTLDCIYDEANKVNQCNKPVKSVH